MSGHHEFIAGLFLFYQYFLIRDASIINTNSFYDALLFINFKI